MFCGGVCGCLSGFEFFNAGWVWIDDGRISCVCGVQEIRTSRASERPIDQSILLYTNPRLHEPFVKKKNSLGPTEGRAETDKSRRARQPLEKKGIRRGRLCTLGVRLKHSIANLRLINIFPRPFPFSRDDCASSYIYTHDVSSNCPAVI